MAGLIGDLAMIKYCVANQCPSDESACAGAALKGHIECLKYLHEEVRAPWDWTTASRAASNGHLHILEYLVERKYGEYNVCLLYTSPSPRDRQKSRMPSSA